MEESNTYLSVGLEVPRADQGAFSFTAASLPYKTSPLVRLRTSFDIS